jgi:DNA-binding response OmpR family regulator
MPRTEGPKNIQSPKLDDAEVELDIPAPVCKPSDDAPVLLIADDDPDIRAMLVRALRGTYTIYEASDGEEARRLLEVLVAPDAFICDVMMPRLDGLQLVKGLRKDPALQRMPVLFLTAKGSAVDVVTGINAGARHYVTKPFKIAEVVAKVASMTNKTAKKR